MPANGWAKPLSSLLSALNPKKQGVRRTDGGDTILWRGEMCGDTDPQTGPVAVGTWSVLEPRRWNV